MNSGVDGLLLPFKAQPKTQGPCKANPILPHPKERGRPGRTYRARHAREPGMLPPTDPCPRPLMARVQTWLSNMDRQNIIALTDALKEETQSKA